jgi:hypothetical protein
LTQINNLRRFRRTLRTMRKNRAAARNALILAGTLVALVIITVLLAQTLAHLT